MKQYSEAQNSEVRAEFGVRQRRQVTAIAVLVGGVVLLWATRQVTHVADDTIRLAGLGAMIVLVGYSIVNWRCPACGKYLGRRLAPKSCPACGVPFAG